MDIDPETGNFTRYRCNLCQQPVENDPERAHWLGSEIFCVNCLDRLEEEDILLAH